MNLSLILLLRSTEFHKKSQLPIENVAEFIAELHRLATHCKFNATLKTREEIDLLLDFTVKASHQKRLLSQKTLTFVETCDIARSMETADCNTKSMHALVGQTTLLLIAAFSKLLAIVVVKLGTLPQSANLQLKCISQTGS